MGALMLVTAPVSAALFVPGDGALSPVRLAMASALLMGNGQQRYEPPTIEQVPRPEVAPQPGVLLAPPPQLKMSDLAVAPQADTGVPVMGRLPAPIARTEAVARFDRLVQAPASNEEILKRLERLEQENQRLKQELSAGKGGAVGAATTVVPPSAIQGRQAPPQMIGGWRVSLYPWNRDAFIGGGATSVFNLPNQRFDATLGQTPYDRSKDWNRVHMPSTEMFLYKFEGWLHVIRAGRHELGFEMNCGFEHPCNLVVMLGGVQLINRRDQKFENTLLQAGLDLEAGDYPVEVVFGLSQNRFMKFEPKRASIYPLYRPPGEYNFRNFGPSELLTEASASIPNGMPRR